MERDDKMTTLAAAEKLSSILLNLVSVLAICFGGWFGLIKFFEYQEQTRLKAGMDIVSEYYSQELYVARSKISMLFTDIEGAMTSQIASSNNPSSAYYAFVNNFVRESRAESEVERLIEFFERAALCVDRQICDEESIGTFLKANGSDFLSTFHPYVCEQRARWADPKIWLEAEQYYLEGIDPDACENY